MSTWTMVLVLVVYTAAGPPQAVSVSVDGFSSLATCNAELAARRDDLRKGGVRAEASWCSEVR